MQKDSKEARGFEEVWAHKLNVCLREARRNIGGVRGGRSNSEWELELTDEEEEEEVAGTGAVNEFGDGGGKEGSKFLGISCSKAERLKLFWPFGSAAVVDPGLERRCKSESPGTVVVNKIRDSEQQ
jgi:hypothetical protein